MTICGVLAQSTVSELARAESWYTAVLGTGPTDRPMDGLVEWQFGEHYGLQVELEPERAGRSTVVLVESDLDGFGRHLDAVGIDHPAIVDAMTVRYLQLEDPDGNRVVVVQ
ncbi:VOC family protein [Gordonia sp. SID5947]|uniref:VOC family protein n=1 Tax=Gordonia sp. SID5947 TaxID=2690315 RepID=UPI001370D9E2|nr:VOC family protein [Gordonia sp. SID5947]MYR08925.1 VOC family protein [Gordonia sp. SID5947]